jgi:serine/threonine-protein kinase RsbW
MLKTIRERDHIEMTYPAILSSVDQAVKESLRFLEERVPQERLFDLKLLLREALLNAVLHGSGADPEKSIHCGLSQDENSLIMTVQDNGPGFDWRTRMGVEPAPDATSGRGLMIMKLYSDDVSYNPTGNAVTIIKKFQSVHAPSPPETKTAEEGSTNNAREPDMFEITKKDDLTIIRPGGDIVASVVENFKTLIQDSLRNSPGPLAIDLSGTSMIDSMGIGLLIAAHNTLSKSGEKLQILNPNPDILTLFRTMRLDKHFLINV